jgi:hypothetical protein
MDRQMVIWPLLPVDANWSRWRWFRGLPDVWTTPRATTNFTSEVLSFPTGPETAPLHRMRPSRPVRSAGNDPRSSYVGSVATPGIPALT